MDFKKVLFLSILLIGSLWMVTFSESYSIGPNYKNISVDTTVNVTNSKPEVLSVIVNNGQNITLNAGTTVLVECNASVRDFNGGSTIANVTGTFYDNRSDTEFSPDDNNSHYSNSSCTQTGVNGFFANYTCGFNVLYYANETPTNTNWACNVTANDVYNFNGTDYGALANYTAINTLLALNVTALIDYGNLAVQDTSTDQEANVTNFGNVGINISVYGYGATQGDGLAMVCDQGNISLNNEKYALTPGGDFATQYTNLTGTGTQVTNLTVNHQWNDSQQQINQTYWRLYVEPNPFGVCNGTVVFQAEPAT